MLNKQVNVFLECDKEFDEAKIIIFGAPFDSTTSYRPGARFGSQAIRSESYGLESYSPYQKKDLRVAHIMDCGDIELPLGDTNKVLEDIKRRTAEILAVEKLPFMLGGEHLITLGAFKAVQEKYPHVNIIHFDAHSDLRADYLGVTLSHACVIRRCYEVMQEKQQVNSGQIYQFGIRSGEQAEFAWGEIQTHIQTQLFNFDNLQETLNLLGEEPIYLTVDLDVLDPAVLPGTGTPEPGGVTFEALRKAVTLVCQQGNVVACDVNELSPHYDVSGASTAVAGKIVREMLLAL